MLTIKRVEGGVVSVWRCRFMWVQQDVEGSRVDVQLVFYDPSLAVLGWSF